MDPGNFSAAGPNMTPALQGMSSRTWRSVCVCMRICFFYVYIYVHVCVCVFEYVCIQMYANTQYMYAFTYVDKCPQEYIATWIHMHILYIDMHASMHAYMHAYSSWEPLASFPAYASSTNALGAGSRGMVE